MSQKECSTSRILIETFVKKALHDAEDGTRRTIRNLVDLAMQFSRGRFQKNFFTTVQTMLQNEHSAYYDLVSDLFLHVDRERLLKMGMNIGYNSCTVGASRIREIEAAEQFNIPWCISMEFDDEVIKSHLSFYQDLIRQGQVLGIYTWILYAEHRFQQAFHLAEQYPDSAFILLCKPETISEAVIEELQEHQNLMVAVQYKDSSETSAVISVCRQLREHRLLYSLYYFYDEKDIHAIQNGDLFYSMQQLHPAFIGMLGGTSVDEDTRLMVYDVILQTRTAQAYPMIVLDLHYDLLRIDQIVSDDCCTAGIDKQGKLCSFYGRVPEQEASIFDMELKELLKQQFPKK